jgi:hypothetical protein
MPDTEGSIQLLRDAFHDRNLTLYLGAGVSIGSNLPSWEQLVLAMYFSKISQETLGGWRPFSNYLYAIAEWQLANSTESLEITARKLRRFYRSQNEDAFLEDLYLSLYGIYLADGQPLQEVSSQMLRWNNATLDAVAKLCESDGEGVRAVVTYNYDSLLEIALGDRPHQSVFNADSLTAGRLPIYHVHGHVPLDKQLPASRGEDIVFTEDQYHHVAENPYTWSSLVQLQLMSNSVGLMVGLSLADRNMRRILDAIRNSPIQSTNFALLKEPDTSRPEEEVLDKIHHKAIDYLHAFENSGIKSEQGNSERVLFPRPGVKSGSLVVRGGIKGEPIYRSQIAGIIEQVKLIETELQEFVLGELGITPIWYKDYADIPGMIEEIIR